jgi:hypothetical protein
MARTDDELVGAQIPDLHVVVKFGRGIPSDVQGIALLEFEKMLRSMMPGQWVETFKEAKGDDSMLRNRLTPEQRMKL